MDKRIVEDQCPLCQRRGWDPEGPHEDRMQRPYQTLQHADYAVLPLYAYIEYQKRGASRRRGWSV